MFTYNIPQIKVSIDYINVALRLIKTVLPWNMWLLLGFEGVKVASEVPIDHHLSSASKTP